MRLRTLTGMALRELWISYRLIPVVGLPVLAGMAVIAVPADLAGVSAIAGAGFWYAVSAGAAICVAATLAASTLAHERRRGTLAWMAVRAVPRSAVLVAWFIGYGLLLVGGIVVGSAGAWLAAISRAEAAIDPIPFIAAVVALACTALVALAAGLLVGTVLDRWVAAVLVLLASGALLAATILGPPTGGPLPTTGIGLLADLGAAARPV
ncbi:MAG: hypothetical protein WD116_03115, partial [Chloroflexota bacterium]